jgi:hypothetical protein
MLAQVEFEIVGVTIKQFYDDMADRLDDYGKFTNTWESGVIPINNRVFKYFKSAQASWRYWKESWAHVSEEDKASVIAKYGSLKAADFQYAKDDLKRVEDYYRDRWSYIGVKVEAKIWGKLPISPEREAVEDYSIIKDTVYDTMYGLESDCPKEIKMWEEELTLNVRRDLSDMGFNMLELDEAFSKIQRAD